MRSVIRRPPAGFHTVFAAVALVGAAVPGCTSTEESPPATGCGAGETACGDRCVLTATDPAHCGGCHVACQPGQQCVAGACTCVGGLAACGPACVDLGSDGANCGACGAACPAPTVCSNSACSAACAAGQLTCGNSCPDPQTSVLHCGACDSPCAAGQTCVAGACTCSGGLTLCGATCTDTLSDEAHCGSCGVVCASGQTCTLGTCTGGGAGGTSGGGGGTGGTTGGAGGTSGGGGTGGTTGGAGGTTGGAGGTTGGGGSTAACALNCSNPPTGSCASPEVRVTEVNVGTTVVNNEQETTLMPISIAPIPSGGSRLAWMGDDGQVHVAQLDCDDRLVGTPFAFPAHDFQDVAADDEGGVLMLTRDATGGGTLNCGTPSNLCDGGPNPPIPCYDMWMLRFDCAGTAAWTTLLTTATPSLPPYSTGRSGATVHMIWWYQHHGRLAHDGSNYAAYFCNAISVSENGCINIHEGDRMQVVGPTGSIIDHPDAFGGGCSHSWNTRMVWDEAAGHFVMVCATDNQGRVARPDPYRTIWMARDLGSLSVGDLVVAPDGGYWVSMSDEGSVHLLHFTEATPDRDVVAASSDFSHLARYGASAMIVGWESGSGIAAQVRSAVDGSPVSAEFSLAVPDNRYSSFEAYPDGSVAYAGPGTSNTSIRVARVLPCSG